jgi:hypothetical protein
VCCGATGKGVTNTLPLASPLTMQIVSCAALELVNATAELPLATVTQAILVIDALDVVALAAFGMGFDATVFFHGFQ